ncbi:MAG TPA: pyridoxal phosphate-dependent aminotransferase [Spirochaetota bacterium]|nr:pyridoxal phosphate-dependent aminotransferase [Spirochaetota bacterium]HOM37889.1 pyridoxal phosphate-dependent aminotransferase [Spirochaetota bacterium]HPQ48693.1 pyridoxal phosphate-dependent aminotransferase [Spirochaetota bacterium]
MKIFNKSKKLDNVCYDIRGPVLEEANKLEQEGYNIIKLNIGNPYYFGLEAPDIVIHDVIFNIKKAQGYSDSKGIFLARNAILLDAKKKGFGDDLTIDDIYIGNGVSELIVMSMQGLLDNDDEILIPSPDYPLWTAAVNLAGGNAVHYICDEQSDWYPDINDIKKKINSKTKGIVIINPNNPTGAVYSKEILEEIVKIAVENQLIIFSDEIYEKIVYPETTHYNIASLTNETLVITFNGLSKSHRIAGFRVGWMILSGNKKNAQGYIEGLNILSSMRLCSNVPAQYSIMSALGIEEKGLIKMINPGGKLYEQRNYIFDKLNDIPGITCVKPKGAFYIFPKVDIKKFNISNDEKLVLDILQQEKILLVHGKGFNWKTPDHFRIVFLPPIDVLQEVVTRLANFFKNYKQE